jgi:hypothetical protein
MHFIKRIENSVCQISLFSWNGKYIVKFEANQLEQTYKIDQTEVASIEEIELIVNEEFIAKVISRFQEMSEDWYSNF